MIVLLLLQVHRHQRLDFVQQGLLLHLVYHLQFVRLLLLLALFAFLFLFFSQDFFGLLFLRALYFEIIELQSRLPSSLHRTVIILLHLGRVVFDLVLSLGLEVLHALVLAVDELAVVHEILEDIFALLLQSSLDAHLVVVNLILNVRQVIVVVVIALVLIALA